MSKLRAIVVDDEKLIADSIQLALINDGTITSVSRSNSVKEAMLKIKDHRYEMIILDLNMPGANGIELIKKLRDIPSYKPEILIVSGQVDNENIKELLELGVKNILTKPFNTKEVVSKIRAMVN